MKHFTPAYAYFFSFTYFFGKAFSAFTCKA